MAPLVAKADGLPADPAAPPLALFDIEGMAAHEDLRLGPGLLALAATSSGLMGAVFGLLADVPPGIFIDMVLASWLLAITMLGSGIVSLTSHSVG